MNRIDKTRRACIALAAALLGAVHSTGYAQPHAAQLIVPFPPGGPADVIARMLSSAGLGEAYGRPVVVDNKPGAAGLIATRLAARAVPDGNTFLFMPNFFLQNAVLYDKPGYDPLKDFAPVTAIGTTYLVFAVNARYPVRTLQDFVADARQRGDAVSFASGGTGTTPHLAGHALNRVAGLNMTHVPYRGEANALQDLVGNQVSSGFFAPVSLMPFVASGQVRVLAIATAQREAEFPAVPTMAEAGFDHPVFHAVGWFGLFAPAASVRRMGEAVASILAKPEVAAKLVGFGIRIWTQTPEQFAALVRKDYAIWTKVITEADVKMSVQ